MPNTAVKVDRRAPAPAEEGCVDLPLSNVLTLAAAAVAHARHPWLDFRDLAAERVWRSLGADVSTLRDIDLRAALGRTLLLDKFARRWALPRRGATLVEVGAGLSTRHARFEGLQADLVTVDEPEISAVRKEVFPGARAFRQVSAPLEERGWVRALGGGAPIFVVVEDAFLDLHPDDVIATLTSLGAELPSGSMVAASFGPRSRMVVAHPGARRPTLEVQLGCRRRAAAVRFPRFSWAVRPTPLDGAELPAVALFELT